MNQKDECTIASLAYLLGKPIQEIASDLGKRILHMEECIDYCMKEGYFLCAISASPRTIDKEGNTFQVYEPDQAASRLSAYMHLRQGLCYCKTDRGTYHVVAWTGDGYYDPGCSSVIKAWPKNILAFYLLVTPT